MSLLLVSYGFPSFVTLQINPLPCLLHTSPRPVCRGRSDGGWYTRNWQGPYPTFCAPDFPSALPPSFRLAPSNRGGWMHGTWSADATIVPASTPLQLEVVLVQVRTPQLTTNWTCCYGHLIDHHRLLLILPPRGPSFLDSDAQAHQAGDWHAPLHGLAISRTLAATSLFIRCNTWHRAPLEDRTTHLAQCIHASASPGPGRSPERGSEAVMAASCKSKTISTEDPGCFDRSSCGDAFQCLFPGLNPQAWK